MIDLRVSYKRRGNVAMSNALKIIINSMYGTLTPRAHVKLVEMLFPVQNRNFINATSTLRFSVFLMKNEGKMHRQNRTVEHALGFLIFFI